MVFLRKGKIQLLKWPASTFILMLFFTIFINYFYFSRGFSFSFSFVDSNVNIAAGYFVSHGKQLYSQIFFEHNPLLAYISATIQVILHPNSLYHLLLYHRVLLRVFAFSCDLFLIFRFRFIGLGFAMLYELIKFYLFGNLFLAESFIVYPIVYQLLLIFTLWTRKRVYNFEIIATGVLSWFIVWMREPYIPLSLLLYISILVLTKNKRLVKISLASFLLLSTVIAIFIDWRMYFLDVVQINFKEVVSPELKASGLNGLGFFKIVFYPILIFFTGSSNTFREIQIALSTSFLLSFLLLLLQREKKIYGILFFSLLVLGLAGIRFEPPGTIFYQAYHMLIWNGLFITFVVYFISLLITSKQKIIGYIIFGAFTLIMCDLFILQPSYLHQSLNNTQQFSTSFGTTYTNGSVVHMLARPNSTLFVDSWDVLIFWQANVPSSYKYQFYLPEMNATDIYTQARSDMFKNYPPTFYYRFTGDTTPYSAGIPKTEKVNYKQLYNSNLRTGLFIRKSLLANITPQEWKQLYNLGYSTK